MNNIFNIIIMWAFCLHNAHSRMVMTQYPTDTLTKYLLHVSKASPRLKEEALDRFHEMNISYFCYELRETYVYQPGPSTSVVSEPEPESIGLEDFFIPTRYNKNMDVEQPGVQLRKFKIENLNQTLSLHSFQCSNNEEKPIWFVATAFVPHSAFLFEVEPKFRHLVGRETEGNNGIPAKLRGLIDSGKMPIAWSEGEDTSFFRYLEPTNFTGKDKICDLHPILQFRLCALGAPQWYHRYRSLNIYDPSDGGCKPVPMKEVDRPDIPKSFISQEMLHCSLRLYKDGLFYIYEGLVTRNPLEMVSVQILPNTEMIISDFNFLSCYRTYPILKYLDSYQSLLKNFDVNL